MMIMIMVIVRMITLIIAIVMITIKYTSPTCKSLLPDGAFKQLFLRFRRRPRDWRRGFRIASDLMYDWWQMYQLVRLHEEKRFGTHCLLLTYEKVKTMLLLYSIILILYTILYCDYYYS